ncbi:hypothetical protein [Nitratireductor sp. L15S-10]
MARYADHNFAYRLAFARFAAILVKDRARDSRALRHHAESVYG